MSIGFQGSFTGGELDPALSARVDLAKYGVGCKTLKNFIVQAHGGAYHRPGFQYVVSALGITHLIPFQYNVEQAYILAFSDLKMRVLKDGGVVLDASSNITAATQASPTQITAVDHGAATGDDVYISGIVGMTELNGRFFRVTVIDVDTLTLDGISSTGYTAYASGGTVARLYTVASPYAEADLFGLHTAQSADTMYITHANYAPRKLTRSDHNSWTFTTVALGTGAVTPSGGTATWNGTAGSGYVYRYKITAVNSDGEESLPSAAVATSGAGEHPPGEWVADNFIGINVPSTAGAVEYYIYKESYGNGIYGYVGSTINTGANAFRDDNYTPDLLYGVPENYDPFSGGAGYYPSAVSFFKQRLWFGASDSLPQSIWASQVGLFDNFNKSSPLKDTDSLEFTLASTQVNAIKWLVPFQDLIIGTSGAEWKAFSSEGGAITPSTTDADVLSYWGSTAVKPIIIGDSIIHIQEQGSKIRDMFYSMETNSYAGNDLTVLVSHFFQGKTLVAWAFQRTPDSILWCVMDDGSLYGLTYLKEHQVWGWHRHETDGTFESVASIPGATYDDVYFVVKRTIDGGTVRYIEKLGDKWRGSDGISAAMFLDSALSSIGGGARTNSILQSRAFDTTWGGVSGPMTQDQVGYDGAVNGAWTLTDDNSSAAVPDYIRQSVVIPDGSNDLTFSVFVGKDSTPRATRAVGVMLELKNGTGQYLVVELDTSSGSLVQSTKKGTYSSSVVSYNADFWRVAVTVRNNSSGNTAAECTLFPCRAPATATTGTAVFDAAQLEQGFSVAGDFIETTTVPVTVYDVATDTFRGLDHLEGETVSALVDGSPVSGLVVSDGTVVLDTEGYVVHIGMPFTAVLAPMGVEALGQEAGSVGRVKSLAKIIIRFSYTVGGKVGPELDYVDALKFTPATYGAAIIPEETLDYPFTPPAGYSRDGSFYIIQDQPLPMTVLALMPDFVVGGM